MKSLLLTGLIAVVSFLNTVNSYTQSLADCKTVAKLFRNTCTQAPDSAPDWTSTSGSTYFASTTFTISGMSGCPTGYGTAPNCAWKRKLCVSCSTDSSTGKVYMRILTNNLPDHGYGGAPTVKEQKVDIKFLFNPAPSGNVTFASQSAFDTAVCQPQKTGTVPSTSGYTNLAATTDVNLDGIAGVAINGVLIFSSSSAENVDPYFPNSWSGAKKVQVETVDACIGHPSFDAAYHYHFLPPCLFDTTNQTKVCEQVAECTSDIRTFVKGIYASKANTLTVLGVARDGHLIYGPYKSSGSLYDCSTLDQCGGTYLSDGSYMYVYTSEYPYSLNCFGPGGAQTYQASCSTNTCSSQASGSKFIQVFSSGFALILLIAMMAL